MTERRAVTFENSKGERLFGILETPPAPRTDIAVVLLCPGVKMRVGPAGLYHAMSKIFLAHRFPVLRFDFSGLGDSEGEITERHLPRLLNTIQDGRFVADTRVAVDWLEREVGYRRVMAAGLCGGALTGLLAAATDARIESLVSVGIPVSFEMGDQDYGRYLTSGELTSLLERRYLPNLLKPGAWLRLLTLQSDFRVIGRVLAHQWRDKIRGRDKAPGGIPANLANVNPRFLPAFHMMLQRRRTMLLLFGGADRWAVQFLEKIEQPNAKLLSPYRDRYQVTLVPEANHILSAPHWRAKMATTIDDWLTKHYSW